MQTINLIKIAKRETPIKIRYHRQELDDNLVQQFEDLKREIAGNAENYAVRNLPPPHNENVAAYFEEEHLKFQAEIDEVNRRLQVNTSIDQVVSHKQTTDGKLRE